VGWRGTVLTHFSDNCPLRSQLQKLLAAAAIFAAALFAQNVPTFRTGVFLVHVDAEVLDQSRRPLTGLTKNDFQILDGGAEQSIIAFSEGEQPLDLILLFDISGSMRSKVKQVAAVAHKGLEQLRTGDRVSVMVFSREAGVVAPFSEDLDAIGQAINRVLDLRFGGGTRIQDAVHEAANRFVWFDNPSQRRRAVLAITDDLGVPAHNKTAVIESLWEADSLLSGLVVNNRTALKGLLAPLGATRTGGIEDFVEQTGGDMIRSDDLSTSFPKMMRRIRSRYTLYYKLPDAQVGSLRKIDVRLSTQGGRRFPGAQVVARRAYRLRERDQYGFASR
jgi:VWFA-related protein